eukprot:scaffold1_cov74-Skeletonema_dohrnii-CCMP3373.AAC.4
MPLTRLSSDKCVACGNHLGCDHLTYEEAKRGMMIDLRVKESIKNNNAVHMEGATRCGRSLTKNSQDCNVHSFVFIGFGVGGSYSSTILLNQT